MDKGEINGGPPACIVYKEDNCLREEDLRALAEVYAKNGQMIQTVVTKAMIRS